MVSCFVVPLITVRVAPGGLPWLKTTLHLTQPKDTSRLALQSLAKICTIEEKPPNMAIVYQHDLYAIDFVQCEATKREHSCLDRQQRHKCD